MTDRPPSTPRRRASGSRALLLMALGALALCAVVYFACARLITGGQGRPPPARTSP